MGAGQVVACPRMHMSEPDIHDDTADDHERLERDRLAQDRDVRRPSTADLDDETAEGFGANHHAERDTGKTRRQTS